MGATPRKIGAVLDSLGVQADLEDGDMIVSAVVLLRVVDSAGDAGFVMTRDEAATWMDEFLLVKLADREVGQAALSGRDDG